MTSHRQISSQSRGSMECTADSTTVLVSAGAAHQLPVKSKLAQLPLIVWCPVTPRKTAARQKYLCLFSKLYLETFSIQISNFNFMKLSIFLLQLFTHTKLVNMKYRLLTRRNKILFILIFIYIKWKVNGNSNRKSMQCVANVGGALTKASWLI